MAERAVNITCKENEFQGMLEYREGDKSRLIKTLITGMFDLLSFLMFIEIFHSFCYQVVEF